MPLLALAQPGPDPQEALSFLYPGSVAAAAPPGMLWRVPVSWSPFTDKAPVPQSQAWGSGPHPMPLLQLQRLTGS